MSHRRTDFALLFAIVLSVVSVSPAWGEMTANFFWVPIEPTACDSVTFFDRSTGEPIGWCWDFNDDGLCDSLFQIPSSQNFPSPGIHPVRLRAYYSGSEFDEITKDVTVSSCSSVEVSFTEALYSVSESAGGAAVTVRRTGDSEGAITVDYATSDGSAVAGQDYVATAGTLTWSDGDTTDKTILVPLFDDADPETDESFTIALTDPTGAGLTSPSIATVIITASDIDCSGLSVSPESYDIDDYHGETLTFQITAPDECPWSVEPENASWIQVIDNATGLGTMDVMVQVDFNRGPTRSGSILVQDQADLGVSQTASVTQAASICLDDGSEGLCLVGDGSEPDSRRFRVELAWKDFQGEQGVGTPVDLRSDDTGILWFFDEANWEMLVKVLDACRDFDYYWILGAATTNVEYTLSVTDTETGENRQIFNPLGQASEALANTAAFSCSESTESSRSVTVPPGTRRANTLPVQRSLSAQSECMADVTTLCLKGGRFRVSVDWQKPDGSTGVGTVAEGETLSGGTSVPGTSEDSGLFWFFRDSNWEMMVKVLDGCGINDHFWVLSAAATNVEYTLTVEDTVTGQVNIYFNEQGVLAPSNNDTSAFETCGES